MQLSWSHMVVYVRDLESMLDFYTRVLGFEITDRGPVRDDSTEIVFLSQSPSEHHQLAFLTTRSERGPSNSVDHAAFRVASLAELRELIATLGQEGVELGPRSHGNTWSVYFHDPEQNGIEIFCDTPWFVKQPVAIPWDMALSDAELHEWTKQTFAKHEEFSELDSYYARRAEALAER